MKLRVILSPGAKADFSSAVRWYLRTDPQIAFEFTQDTLKTLDRIGRYPNSFKLVGGLIRRAFLQRFPYVIYYSLNIGSVSVIAIVHQRRDDILTLDGGNGYVDMRDP